MRLAGSRGGARGQSGQIPRPPVWVVAAGKGGVGTSTLAGMLAMEAGLNGLKVLLVDGDVNTGHIHRLFGLADGQPGFGNLVERSANPDQIMKTVSPGVTLIPGGGGLVDGRLPTPGQRSGLYGRIERRFAAFELVIIDGGARLDSIMPALTNHVRGVLGVTGSSRVSMAGTYALLKVLGQRDDFVSFVPVFNLVRANEAETLYGLLDEATQRFLGVPLGAAGAVPHDDQIASAPQLSAPLLVDPLRGALRALLAIMIHDQSGRLNLPARSA